MVLKYLNWELLNNHYCAWNLNPTLVPCSLPCTHQLFLLKNTALSKEGKRHIIPEQGSQLILSGLLTDFKSKVFKALCQFAASFSSWAQPGVQVNHALFLKSGFGGFVFIFNIQSSFYTCCNPKRPISNGCKVAHGLQMWDEMVALPLNVFSFMTAFQIYLCFFFWCLQASTKNPRPNFMSFLFLLLHLML